jgi:hypothetical protein
MFESGIKSEVFAPVKKNYHTATRKPKPRMALLQGEENDVTISNTSDEPPMKVLKLYQSLGRCCLKVERIL